MELPSSFCWTPIYYCRLFGVTIRVFWVAVLGASARPRYGNYDIESALPY